MSITARAFQNFEDEKPLMNSDGIAPSVILSEAKDLTNVLCAFVRSLAYARDDQQMKDD
jgi:hypothetical protein